MAALGLACQIEQTQSTKPVAPASSEMGMVSSAHPLATQAGLEVLEAGGNAFDAAVAVAAALNVVEPMMSGIGGYGTILVYDAAEGEIHFLNSSGRIPSAVDSDVFRAPTPGYKENRRGAKAVSTPANLRAWESMSGRFGRLAWPRLLQPAIRLARDGFELGPREALFIKAAFEEFPPHAQEIFGREGKPLTQGQKLVQSDLAATFQVIAEQGAEALHGGQIGQRIDQAMRQAEGFLSLDDLQQAEPEWRQPICIDYRGHQVCTASPPATAFPSLIRLGIMSQFDPDSTVHNSSVYLHRFAEATKHAFWSRLAFAGDPDISPPPLDRLLSVDYWSRQARSIDPQRARPFVPPGGSSASGENTTHFVVADSQGNIVSATQTLGNSFGSRILVEGTGIWLNNSLAYCTFEPKGNPMDAHAGHRKLSGDCPTIILRDGKPWAALGTPGGHTIGQTVPQMVMNLIDFRMDIAQALAAPRISFIEPDRLAVEDLIDEAVRLELKKMGHNVQPSQRIGNAHGLTIEYDAQGKPVRFLGAADWRGSGLAQGQ